MLSGQFALSPGPDSRIHRIVPGTQPTGLGFVD
jgi:hypothetical protein